MREPGIGELTGRIDDLEHEVHSLRTAFIMFAVLGITFWLELRERKGGKDVD